MSVTESMIAPQLPPPAPPRPFTAARFAGILFMAFWLVVFGLAASSIIEGFDAEKFYKYGPKFLSGLSVTIVLVLTSIILGALLSLPVAFARMSGSRILSAIAYGYVYFFRGTPLIAQLYLIYYGFGSFKPQLEAVGLWWFFREAYNCALLSFTLNTAAYQAEILRGAIESVPRGQREAAHALGLGGYVTYLRIIMPQALIVALRPYGNEIILMIKGSAIVAIVTVFDLMGETRRAYSRTFDMQMYLWAGLLYLTIVEALRNFWNVIERRLTRHLKR
ncbi:ABC transporter permease [Rhizobium alvei]|jgi:polar amino acid transport system permease protein|uniref:ABC transporter permease n=1 Tax=Rhizobium alvei TaxID=1132659 RepID=A0ABT8YJN3_9HYPH|nr:ABC transporter permease [Rhizobium alvei]MDO6963916.1 ABC transporter permease [Rhizobium alvei]